MDIVAGQQLWGCKGKEWHLEPFFFVLSSDKVLVKWQNLCSVKISVHLHSRALNSNPVMTIIMIIMNNRGQSCGLWEANLEDLCLIFSIYGCVVLDSHWNQWDSFQQLPWSLAGALNCLLQQGKINRAVGSSSADDWIDNTEIPFHLYRGSWERPRVQRRELLCWWTNSCTPLP